MKKLISLLIISMVSLFTSAQRFEVDGIKYKIISKIKKTVAFDKIDKKFSGSLIIPETIEYKNETYRVTEIDDSGGFPRDGVTSISIPNSVTSIGNWAFSSYNNITSVIIPNSVITIRECAFLWCSNLTSVIIPNSVTSIGESAFNLCSNLTSIIIPNSAIKIGKYCFSGCNKINDVRCEDGSFPLWILPYLPEECPFMVAQKYQQYGGNNNMYAQNVQQPAVQTTPVVPKAEKKAPSSDVDKNIFVDNKIDNNSFAVIIGNEKYKNEADVPFAENDAKIFKEYVHKTLGVPEKQIKLVPNAGLNDLRIAIRWLKQAMDVCGGQGKAIFYYAGHGIPDEADKTALLLPIDGIGSDPESAYSLQRLYDEFNNMPAQRTTVFLDACFSGSKREGNMMASARGVAIDVNPMTPKGKTIVYTAAQGDQTAYSFKEQQHGMFTYFLLKKLQDTNGDVTLGELSDYLTTEVKRKSFIENNKIQTPAVSASHALTGSWRDMKLK